MPGGNKTKTSPKKEHWNVLKEARIRVLLEKDKTEIAVRNDKITPARKRSTIVIDDINYDPLPLYEGITKDALPAFAILPSYANLSMP